MYAMKDTTMAGCANSVVPLIAACSALQTLAAINSLKADHEFPTKGDVFTKDNIEAYIDLRMEEVMAFETSPHPIEFKMYYLV